MVQLNEKSKYEIIIKYELGYSIRNIANEMKISKTTVVLWIKRYEQEKNIKRKKGYGRNRKTSKEDDKFIIELISNNKLSSATDIKNNFNDIINISKGTIINRLHECNYQYKNPKMKPFLTEDQKKKD
jgi:transposase